MIIANDATVKAGIGQSPASDELGGAKLHSRLSGTIDFREEDDEAARQELLSDIRRRYFDQLDVRYAAARLWVDRIVQPNRTREALKMVLDVVRCNPDIPEFKTGVLQV